ncbi:cilia-and flagella-associated protein [Trichonephila clavipes]|nr:cilia-and flagella-associated protein [Trichonephila clavipes]
MEENLSHVISLVNNNSPKKIDELYPFKLHWVFGHDTKVIPINISSATIKGIFFTSGAVGVCYDWAKKSQIMLLGHVSNIISIATTHSKTYLASADSGPENSLIVWHAKTGKIVFIVSGCFLDGVKWMCFSGDDNILLTLSGGIPQVISL